MINKTLFLCHQHAMWWNSFSIHSSLHNIPPVHCVYCLCSSKAQWTLKSTYNNFWKSREGQKGHLTAPLCPLPPEDSALASYRQCHQQCLVPGNRRRTICSSDSGYTQNGLLLRKSIEKIPIQVSDNIKISIWWKKANPIHHLMTVASPFTVYDLDTVSWKSQRRLLNFVGSPYQVPYHLHCGKIAGLLKRAIPDIRNVCLLYLQSKPHQEQSSSEVSNIVGPGDDATRILCQKKPFVLLPLFHRPSVLTHNKIL